MYKKIIRNTGIVSAGTLISRLLGAARDIFIAHYFGTSAILEAFLVAFRIPNVLRHLFGEGFSDAVATPVFSEYRKNPQELSRLGSKVFSLLLVVLVGCTVLGIFLAKYLVILIAPGFLTDPAKFLLTVSFTRVTFLYLLFIGLIAVMSSLLYALKKFFIPAFLPAVFNLAVITGLIFFSQYFRRYILVISVIAAGLIQYILVYIGIRRLRLDIRFHWGKGFGDLQIRRMLKLFFPRVGASVIYHLNVFIDTIFSSLSWIVGQGALAAIYYANRIVQFPLALISVSIARVIIFDLSGFHGDRNLTDFKRLFVFAMRNMLFFILPTSIILLIMSGEVLDVIFVRGNFGTEALNLTTPVLGFYSLGLIFFCSVKLLVHSFYSLKDTATPAKISAIALLINVLLSAALMFPLRIGGVALASSISAFVQTVILYRILVEKIGPLPWRNIRSEIVRLCLLGGTVGAAVKLFWFWSPFSSKYINAGIDLVGGAVIFILCGIILGIEQIRYVKQWILRKT